VRYPVPSTKTDSNIQGLDLKNHESIRPFENMGNSRRLNPDAFSEADE